MITIDELKERLKEYKKYEFTDDLIRQALSLLHEWGEIVYFSSPPSLSQTIFLDPRMLTKDVLAQLFHPEHKRFAKNGILDHSQLPAVWKGLESKHQYLMELMYKVNACFELTEEDGQENINRIKNFYEKKSVVCGLLPEKQPSSLDEKYLKIKEQKPFEITRLYKFNVIPIELISLMISKLNQLIHDNIFWRHGGLFCIRNTFCLMRSIDHKNELEIILRGENSVDCFDFLKTICEYLKLIKIRYPGVSIFRNGKAIGEDLKSMTGSEDEPSDILSSLHKWYVFEPFESWNRKEDSQYFTFILNGTEIPGSISNKAQDLLKQTGLSKKIHNGHVLYNKHLLESFLSTRRSITNQQKRAPQLFNKQDWEKEKNKEIRQDIRDHLTSYLSKFENEDDQVFYLLSFSLSYSSLSDGNKN